MADEKTQETASPIATQETVEEIARRIVDFAQAGQETGGTTLRRAVRLRLADDIAEALFSAERRNEELVRERDEAREAAQFHEHNWLQERDLKVAAITGHRAAEATIASLTGQVGEMQERAAKVVEGHIYKERYRKWDFQGGNRSDDGEIVKFADRAAAAIRALEPSPPGISTTGGDGWMPIDETTQKGAVFLGWGARMGMRVIDLDDEGHPWSDEGQHPIGAFTHWRPLPRPPGEPEA